MCLQNEDDDAIHWLLTVELVRISRARGEGPDFLRLRWTELIDASVISTGVWFKLMAADKKNKISNAYSKKSIGPRTEPCGTLNMTERHLEQDDDLRTDCVRPVR